MPKRKRSRLFTASRRVPRFASDSTSRCLSMTYYAVVLSSLETFNTIQIQSLPACHVSRDETICLKNFSTWQYKTETDQLETQQTSHTPVLRQAVSSRWKSIPFCISHFSANYFNHSDTQNDVVTRYKIFQSNFTGRLKHIPTVSIYNRKVAKSIKPLPQREPVKETDAAVLCDRCGDKMFRMHAVWRCPSCGYKTDCCGW